MDKKQILAKCSEKAPLIVDLAKNIGRTRLWGVKAVIGLQMFSRAMGHHGKGENPCHLCNTSYLQKTRLIDHILEKY